jgi:cell division septal protein FtsQ
MEDENQQVVITDIKMPFISMVVFMIKWVFAMIPALIIVAALFFGATILISMFNIKEMLGGFIP